MTDEERFKRQLEYLDGIDIEKYMPRCENMAIHELMQEIEADYNNTEYTNNEVLEGYIFNFCNEAEFIDYLQERYGDRNFGVSEICYYRFYMSAKEPK